MAATEQCQHPSLIETYVLWLDAQERSRYERYRFPRHRHEYLVAHALLRSCLSRYAEQPPQDWRFSINAYGQPEIQVEQGEPPLRFNLSHTEGLVTCAITRAADVGIDVEYGGQPVRAEDLAAIAAAHFAPVELAELARLTGIAWRHRFFDIWTLKEAYIKAQGKGLSLPLQQFALRLQPGGPVPIQLDADSAPDPCQDWGFALLRPTQSHHLAVAVRCPMPRHLQIGQAVPGLAFQPQQLPVMSSQGWV